MVVSLQTSRLLLRRFSVEDAAAVAALASDRDIALNTLLIPHPYSLQDALQWIASQGDSRKAGEAFEFAITLGSDATLIGAIGLTLSDEKSRAELGFWIGRRFWGLGYGTEAARSVMEFGFQNLGLRRIFAQHFARNAASRRVLAKLGMQHEGILRKHLTKWNEPQDLWVWGILRHEFEKPAAAAERLQEA